ncbi:hypothetical protein KJ763_00010 [Patescibacteria group bacterium]|nr:hypothetical protein [Patescibacteria group bacterium]
MEIYICIDCGYYKESKEILLVCKKCKGRMKSRKKILFFDKKIEQMLMADK